MEKKEKELWVYTNGVAVVRLHNRRITVTSIGPRMILKFERFAPEQKPQPDEKYKRGIITRTIAISEEGAGGLALAIIAVLKKIEDSQPEEPKQHLKPPDTSLSPYSTKISKARQ